MLCLIKHPCKIQCGINSTSVAVPESDLIRELQWWLRSSSSSATFQKLVQHLSSWDCALSLPHTAADIFICFCQAGFSPLESFQRGLYTIPDLFTTNSNRNIWGSGKKKKKKILFDLVYLPHKVVCSSRKIESIHRWDLLHNCYFAPSFSSFVFTHRPEEREKALQLKLLHRGHSHWLPTMTRTVSSFLFIQLHVVEAFCRRVQAASDCCGRAFMRWSTWLLSQGWAMIEQLFRVLPKKQQQSGARGAWLRRTPLLSNHKEMLLRKVMSEHSWLIIFSATDTGCHFGSAESKIRFQIFRFSRLS